MFFDKNIIEVIYNEIINYIYGIIVFKHINSDECNTNKKDMKTRYHIYKYSFIINYINQIYYIQNETKRIRFIMFMIFMKLLSN